ncbi:MAG: hypothetical protein HZB76_00420, partial [Chlamydiae bacterium]|nr:hypothetical protein [Chlamydiota bacterium]
MSGQVLFNTNIFKSYETLQGFFSGTDEITAIKANTATTKDMQISLAKKVAVFVMVPFNFIAGYFFSISSFFLGLVHADNLAIRCKVLSSYFSFNFSCFKNITLLGKDLLVLAKNMHDPSTTDVYLSKQMERKSISKDERLIKLIYTIKVEKLNEKISMTFRKISPFCDKDKNEKKGDELNKFILNKIDKKFGELTFLSLIGNCYGMSVWFAYLYLNSNQANQDPLKHISVVAKLFENGAPREASILQSLFSNCDLNKIG